MTQLAPVATSGLIRCPRCRGPMFPESDGVRTGYLCLLCGEYRFPNTRPHVQRNGASPALARIINARAPDY